MLEFAPHKKEFVMFIEAFLFGITIAVAIGPIALLIVNTSVNRGALQGLACGAGAAFADFTFALTAFLGGSTIIGLLDAGEAAIEVFASLTLLVLGAWLVVQAWRQRTSSAVTTRSGPGFLGTCMLTLANPLTIIFFAAWLGSRQHDLSVFESILAALSVFAGSLLVQVALALGGDVLGRLLSRGAMRVTLNIASGLGVMAFGVLRL